MRCPASRVGSAHGAGYRVMEKHGCTIGGEDHQGHTGIIGDDRVALRVVPVEAAAAVISSHHPNDVRMGLPGQHQIIQPKAQGISQNGQILPDILFRFPFLDGNVQGIENSGADTAVAGGEAMGHGDAFRSQIFQ